MTCPSPGSEGRAALRRRAEGIGAALGQAGVSCPANWNPGEDVVLGAPRTQVELETRLTDDSVKLTDWYLATKPGTPA
ncbi:hypothetical protein [Streptomyces sp. NPDC050538]|uniref:hypothetical protein n=1 Tax=Streptomyces sp. NPDC050538 TaxID=3365627 RepID=UPI0037960242